MRASHRGHLAKVLAHRILLRGQGVVPRHHPAIVRIPRAGHTDLVSVVNHRHSVDGQDERQAEFELLVSRRIVDPGGLGPTDLFLVADFRIGQVAVGIGHEAGLVVVAEQRRHQRLLAVDGLGIGQRPLQLVHPRTLSGEDLDDSVIKREIKLPVQHVGSDKTHDPLAIHESFADIVERNFPGGIDRAAQGGAVAPPERTFDMLHRVETVAVELEADGEIDGVADEEFYRLRIVEIEAGQPLLEPCGELLVVPKAQVFRSVRQFQRTKQPGLFLPKRMVEVDMLEHEVGDDEHAIAVRHGYHFGQGAITAETRLDLGMRDGPVAVVTRVETVRLQIFLPSAVGIAVEGCEPEDIDPEFIKVTFVDLLADALKVSALVVGWGQDSLIVNRPVVARVTIGEAVGEGVVDDAVLPLERVGNFDRGSRGIAYVAFGVGHHHAHPRSRRPIPGRHRHGVIRPFVRRDPARSVGHLHHRGDLGDVRAARDNTENRLALAGVGGIDDGWLPPVGYADPRHRVLVARAIIEFFRVGRIEHPLAVDHQLVRMRTRRHTHEQLVISLTGTLQRMRLGIPAVELPRHVDFFDVRPVGTVGKGVTIGRLHPDQKHALENGLLRTVTVLDRFRGVLAAKIAARGAGTLDDPEGNFDQPGCTFADLHRQLGGDFVETHGEAVRIRFGQNQFFAHARFGEVKAMHVEHELSARGNRLHRHPAEKTAQLPRHVFLRGSHRYGGNEDHGGEKREGSLSFHGRSRPIPSVLMEWPARHRNAIRNRLQPGVEAL